MRQKVARWLVAAAVALALGLGFASSTTTHATVFHPLGPTATPTPLQTDGSDPGSHGGGGGG